MQTNEAIYCFQETKLEGHCDLIVKHFCSNMWAEHVGLEASGNSGRISIMWDKRLWKGELVNPGVHNISCRFSSLQDDFTWYLTEVYGPQLRTERQELWFGIGSHQGGM